MIIQNPLEIEKRSMEIIREEIGSLNLLYEEETVIKRIIHATADLEFAQLTRISPGVLKIANDALKSGSQVVTDVAMVKAGVNKRILQTLGCEVKTYIADQDVHSEAKKAGITRSMAAMRKAIKDQKNRIFLIGNAPTALFELIRLVREERVRVDLIIGTPVGFVGAKESKAELMKTDIPYITVQGRKGGSPVTAAAFNALLYMIAKDEL